MIWEAVVKLDVLGLGRLSVEKSMLSSLFAQAYARPRLRDAAPAAGAFAFETSGDKVAAFMEWLYEQERRELLDIVLGAAQRSAASSSWQNVYIDSAYQQGLRSAQKELGLGEPFIARALSQPIHADRVGLIYARVYRDLEGITDAMDLAISRALAQGIAEGRGMAEIAYDLQAAVDGIGIARARVLARTEVVAAHAEATLNSYEEAGVLGVEADVEFATAGDSVVCPQCADLSGKVYSVANARGVIPVHPNCRCAWLPVTS